MITIATISGVVAGVLLGYISAIGWKDVKWTLTLPFVVVAGCCMSGMGVMDM